jgi:outer membrane protein assembly factor BamD
MMKHTLYGFAVLLFALSACNGYNKVLKSDDYARKFEMANELYDKGQEVRSIALYEQVYQRMPKASEGELAYFRIGKAYYIGNDYYMAGYFLGQFNQRFPSSPKAEEALFLSAMCSVQNSPEASLDQHETELAINDLQQFVNRYPNSSLVDSCNHTIDRLRFKLEVKAYKSVQLYSKTENYRAAVTSAIIFLTDYSRSQFKEEVQYILVKNSYHYAKNSVDKKKSERYVEAKERYRNFVAEFPESKYLTILGRYMDDMESQEGEKRITKK